MPVSAEQSTQLLIEDLDQPRHLEIHERERTSELEISDDDIKTVMEQSNCSEDKAKEVLKETNGNIAEAIMKLQEE